MKYELGPDTTIKMLIDGEINVFPEVALSVEEKTFLSEGFFKDFHKIMKIRLRESGCLEGHEYHEMASNPALLQGRAFIYMSRCLERFDKSRYVGSSFGLVSPAELELPLDSHEFEFAINFNIIKKSSKTSNLSFKKIRLGLTLEDATEALLQKVDVLKLLKETIAIERLKFYWVVFYRKSINELAWETLKWKKNKGIPTLTELRKYIPDGKEFVKSAQEEKDYHAELDYNSNTIEIKDEFWTKDETWSVLLAGIPLATKKFIYCSNVLKMDFRELLAEFEKDFNSLRKEEHSIKKQLMENKDV